VLFDELTFDISNVSLYTRVLIGGHMVKKIVTYIIGILVGLVILLGSALGVFLKPLFQADVMLAQIRVEDVVSDRCYLVSLEIAPEKDDARREKLLSREPICGDFLGLGFEFALPDKTLALMKKPGIVLRNLVAYDKTSLDQTGNILVGQYKIEMIESLRSGVSDFLRSTPVFKSITYDVKAIMQKPKKGAIISYTLEPLRQQVIVECEGCQK
jgi:hypothetical protein